MQEWSVTIDAEVKKAATDEQVDRLADELKADGGAIAAGGERISVTMTIRGPDWASGAADIGERTLARLFRKVGLGDAHWIGAEVVTVEEQERRLSEPNFPDLIGVAELAEILKVSRQRASELARLESFPRPITWLASGPIWIRTSVNNFVDQWPRKPGRPRNATVNVPTAKATAKANAPAVVTPDGVSGPAASPPRRKKDVSVGRRSG